MPIGTEEPRAVADTGTVLIAGAGQAGLQTAASLRQSGFGGRVVLVGEEAQLPYQRPPLSKAYLTGKLGTGGIRLRGEEFFAAGDIELRGGERVVEIDRLGRAVRLASGEQLGYDHLVLALGARNRPLPVPGAYQTHVFGLRSVEEADKLRVALVSARRVAVVGAGFIGLEFAAVASEAGLDVTVVEAAPRAMARSVSEPMSEFFAGFHRGRGVRMLFGAGVSRILGEHGFATGLRTETGETIEADLIVVGIGILPETELAEHAGLAVDDGVVVDERLRTSDPAISAIGDCARFPGKSGPVRLESVQNAVDQARCLAAALTGEDRPYSAVPWFWSDQASVKLQIAGLSHGHDRTVLRGSPEEGAFSVFCFQGDELLAAESVGRASEHMAVRRILGAAAPLSAEQAADPGFDLKSYSRSVS